MNISAFETALGAIGDHMQTFRSQAIHVDQFRGPFRDSYIASVGSAIESEAAKLQSPVVLDFGCWSGVTSLLIAHMRNVCSVIGVDIDQKSMEFAKTYIQPLHPGLEFRPCDSVRLPLDDGSVDLIAINQVFCNMNRGEFEPMIAELARATARRTVVADR